MGGTGGFKALDQTDLNTAVKDPKAVASVSNLGSQSPGARAYASQDKGAHSPCTAGVLCPGKAAASKTRTTNLCSIRLPKMLQTEKEIVQTDGLGAAQQPASSQAFKAPNVLASVSNRGGESPGARAYAWQDNAHNLPNCVVPGSKGYGLVFLVDGEICTPQSLARASRQRAAHQCVKPVVPRTQSNRLYGARKLRW